MKQFRFLCLTGTLFALWQAAPVRAQQTGALRGEVTLENSEMVLHNATVLIPRLGRSVETDRQGRYEFTGLPPGEYDVLAHMHHLSDDRRRVVVSAGGEARADFRLGLGAVRERVTVTASGREETSLETFLAVTSLGSLELMGKAASSSLGELLDDQSGVAKRSFGPGTGRPVVRGFDGDRVLVLEDGVQTGTLSSQSGDHGEPVDASYIERLEVVRGPATLLYGSNAIGGVVNVLTSHHEFHEHPHEGLRGHLSGLAGSNNAQAGGSGRFEYGQGRWLLWGGGGAQRSGDYSSPEGVIPNSSTDMAHATIGFGRYGERGSFSLSYGMQDGRYGIPFAHELGHGAEAHGTGAAKSTLAERRLFGAEDEADEEDVAIDWRRQRARMNASWRNPQGAIESVKLKLNFTDWNHRELEGDEVGTEFFNKQLSYRLEARQRARGRLSGAFGISGMHRSYEAAGEEALTPPVSQNGLAAFVLEEIDFERFRLQFGGRLEHSAYDPEGLRKRSFTGGSAGVGVHLPLWEGAAAVANYTHSFRAPAMEELYNRGPHPGNLLYEIGDSNLRRERGDGVDLSWRQQTQSWRAEVNFFRYAMKDFIFLAPTGQFKDGLPVARVSQGNSRFLGAEASVQRLLRPGLWLDLGFDSVDAHLTEDKTPLPRIPPLRGRAGIELRHAGFSLKPQLHLANAQFQLAPNEDRTAGYATAGLAANYTIPGMHRIHMFSVNFSNVGNRLYRNHLSLIKELAPEMGRALRFSYTLHFF